MARIRKVDAGLDRQIITGMIVSTPYLREVSSLYKPEFLTAPFAIQVAGWCLDYYKSYEKAPVKHIQDIFYTKQREGLDDERSEQIEKFLQSLSDEYEHADKFNVQYLLDQTEKLFRRRSLKHLAEDIEAHLSQDQIEDAECCIKDFKKVTRPVGMGIDPLTAMDVYQRAFSNREEPLFLLPGAYGELINPHLIRGGFIAFLGPAKVGKTWRLMDLAFRAIASRCNVAFFQTGDLTEDDFIIRQSIHFAKRSNDIRYCGELFVPILDCEINQNIAKDDQGEILSCPYNKMSNYKPFDEQGTPDLECSHQPCTYCRSEKGSQFKPSQWWVLRPSVEPLSWQAAWRQTQLWKKRHRARAFKLHTSSNSSINVQGIVHQLDLWEQYEGFVPDVIIIDYADIMAAEDNRKEKRHQEDDRWKALRRLSQDRHCLVATATQTNRSGFGGEDIQVTNVGEDKRKMDHVTAFFGLNRTEQEEEDGVIRVSNLLSREGKRNVFQQAVILQCLEIGQPYLASYWKNTKKEKKLCRQ